MKKTIAILLVCSLACFGLFADNNQKIYSVDDDIYTDIANIYIVTGHALPSATGPWSGAELLGMIEKIDEDSVPEGFKDSYYSILEELDEEPEHQWKGIGATFTNEFNFQLAFHTNTDSEYTRQDLASSGSGLYEQLFIGRDNWASEYVQNLYPLYGLNWETWVEDHIYSYFKFGVYNSYNGNVDNDFGTSKLTNNIVCFQNFKLEAGFIDANFPYRGFFSVGSDHWNLEVGREQLSWGSGSTGNLTISDNLLYHNMAKFTAFGDKYKYTFLTSFFPHPKNYYGTSYDGHHVGYNYITGQDGLDGLSMYIAHRIEGRFFKDKLNLILTEAVMYESSTNHVDLIALSPMAIFHNAYTPDVSNSTLSLEFDFTPFKKFNFYGQFLVDEFAIPGIEDGASADNKDTPNRYAYLAGMNYVTSFEGGIFKVNAEYAKVDPYTYLRDSGDYGLDYVVPVRIWSTAGPGAIWNEYFMGYTYGCDSKVISLSATYEKGPVEVSFGFLDVYNGTHDQWTIAGDTGGDGEEAWAARSSTCTTEEEYGSRRYTYTKNAVENTLDLSATFAYKLFNEKLTVYGQADIVIVNNAYNLTNQNDKDFQLVVGATYAF